MLWVGYAEAAPQRYSLSGFIESGVNEFTVVVPQQEDARSVMREGLVEGEAVEVAGLRRADPGASVPETAPLVVRQEQTSARDNEPVVNDRRSFLSRVRPGFTGYVRGSEIDYADGTTGSSLVSIMRSSFDFSLEQSDWELDAHYVAEYGSHLSGDRDDTLGHDFSVDYERRVSSRNALILTGSLEESQDQRPDDQVIEDFNSLVGGSSQTSRARLGAGWIHGSERDRFRHVVNYSFDTLDFTGERITGEASVNLGTAAYQLRFRADSRLTWFMDATMVNGSFDHGLSTREVTLTPGVEWLRSRRFMLKASAGLSRYDEERGETGNGLTWQLDSYWHVSRRSTLRLKTGRDFLEQPGQSGEFRQFAEQTWLQGLWQRRWSPAWRTNLRVTLQDREDRLLDSTRHLEIFAGAVFQPSARLSLKGDLVYTRRDGETEPDFNRWTLTFGATYSL